MTIGERLKAVRNDHDLNQEQVAKIIGCSRKQIIRYEHDEQKMTIENLIALCQLFNTSSDYILGLPKNLSWPRER